MTVLNVMLFGLRLSGRPSTHKLASGGRASARYHCGLDLTTSFLSPSLAYHHSPSNTSALLCVGQVFTAAAPALCSLCQSRQCLFRVACALCRGRLRTATAQQTFLTQRGWGLSSWGESAQLLSSRDVSSRGREGQQHAQHTVVRSQRELGSNMERVVVLAALPDPLIRKGPLHRRGRCTPSRAHLCRHQTPTEHGSRSKHAVRRPLEGRGHGSFFPRSERSAH